MKWYSLIWQPRDYRSNTSFSELNDCPKFVLTDEFSKSELESHYPNVYLIDYFESVIFVEKDGYQLPTHYRNGHLMPGDTPKYDAWLLEHHEVNRQVLQEVLFKQELYKKNLFLQYAGKVIRHDMHSGINTYLPRGIKSLEDRLTPALIKKHKLALPLKLLKEGVRHSQQVYQTVYAFTNLAKESFDVQDFDLAEDLRTYMVASTYAKQVHIDGPIMIMGNSALLCSAFNVFVRNGFQFNNNAPSKRSIRIYSDNKQIFVEDNGIGMDQSQLLHFTNPTTDFLHNGQLDFNIAIVIIREHGFSIEARLLDSGGTQICIGL